MPKELHTLTLKMRLGSKHNKMLNEQSREVNFVWNYINELSSRAIKERGKFLSEFDINYYLSGSTKEGLSLHSQTLQGIAGEYVTRRKQFKKRILKWRSSFGSKKSLGWIPFKKASLTIKGNAIFYQRKELKLFRSYDLTKYQLSSGSFSQDAKGNWYLNICAKTHKEETISDKSVGIDLGLKSALSDSNGQIIIGRNYRKLELKLGKAQRAKNKTRVRAIHAKIKNRRKDELHKYSSRLVKENKLIVVGNVSTKKLVKTKMAKSTLDAGWGMLKSMLEYKCQWANVDFKIVNEAYSSQTCSCCGLIGRNSPKGRAGLGIREWTCDSCDTLHNRDINAARNILALGHERLAVGIPAL